MAGIVAAGNPDAGMSGVVSEEPSSGFFLRSSSLIYAPFPRSTLEIIDADAEDPMPIVLNETRGLVTRHGSSGPRGNRGARPSVQLPRPSGHLPAGDGPGKVSMTGKITDYEKGGRSRMAKIVRPGLSVSRYGYRFSFVSNAIFASGLCNRREDLRFRQWRRQNCQVQGKRAGHMQHIHTTIGIIELHTLNTALPRSHVDRDTDEGRIIAGKDFVLDELLVHPRGRWPRARAADHFSPAVKENRVSRAIERMSRMLH